MLPAVALVLDLKGEEAKSDSVALVLGKYQPLAIFFVVVVVVAVLGVREQLSSLVRRNQHSAANCIATNAIVFVLAVRLVKLCK